MRKKIICSILALSGLVSCVNGNNSGESAEDKNALIQFKINKPDIASLQSLRLSEFVDSIEYVQLEATNDCLLPYYGRNKIRADNLLFDYNLSDILEFDITTGKYLRHIGSRGQGPNEYVQIQNVRIDADNKRIIIKERSKESMLTFDYEGKPLGKMSFDDTLSLFTSCFYSLSLIDIDKQYMVYTTELIPAKVACHPYEVIVYDYVNKKLLHSIPNRIVYEDTRFTMNMAGMQTITKHDKQIFYRSFYNDTLYLIDKEEGIRPYAVIDFGSRKLPLEVCFSRNGMSEIAGKMLINNIYKNNDCLLMSCQVYYDAKLDDVGFFICKYDIATKKVTYHSNIVNDIDGGANISVDFLSNNGKGFVTPVSEYEGREESIDKAFSNLDKSELKYPALKDKFEAMQSKRDPDDNPLIMILHKKQD